MSVVTAGLDAPPPAALRPSEYTAGLIQVLLAHPLWVRDRNALEIGSGSGVVLAALGSLGARSLCGVDVESEAVEAGAHLLDGMGYGRVAEIHRGDMWLPVRGRQFGVIAANLPHFPMDHGEDVPGRLPTWSSGGSDGRALLDPFLEGLAAHLVPGGHAVLTHNAFVGIARSQEIVGGAGLELRILHTVLVYVAEEKLARMTRSVLLAEEGRSIHRFGPYAFAEVHIVDVSAA